MSLLPPAPPPVGTVKVAAIQAAPVYLDREATVAKACDLIAEAGRNGARLIAFPETFIPGFPYWNWICTPWEGSPWFRRYLDAAVVVPGPATERIGQAARRAGAWVVMGVNERHPVNAVMWNTNVVFDDQGRIAGKHRKLVPTFAEKLTWAWGDGSGLRVYPTDFGTFGTLICGENTNPLARYALLAQGELLHIANYPAWPWPNGMIEGIQIRSAATSYEGKIHTVAVSNVMSPAMIDMLADTAQKREQLTAQPSAYTAVYGTLGQVIAGPLWNDEGIVYADLDLGRSVEPRQIHDLVGTYNRFDIFRLEVDRRPRPEVSFIDVGAGPDQPAPTPPRPPVAPEPLA